MPCVVPTCGASVGTFRSFPLHVSLADRWLEAIQVGCGVKANTEGHSTDSPMEICHWHFGTSTSGEAYQEPKLFYDCHAEKAEIDSCRLCLKFYPSSVLVSKDGKLSGKDIKSLIRGFVQIDLSPNDFLQRICFGCLARLELLKSIEADFVDTDVVFHRLVGIALEETSEVQRLSKVSPPTVEVSPPLEVPPPVEESPPVEMIKQEELIVESEVQSFDEEDVSDEWTPPEPVIDMLLVKKEKYKATRKLKRLRLRRPGLSLLELRARKCYICSVILESQNELASHLIEKHSDLAENYCAECNRSFPMLSLYNNHLARHDKSERPNKCSFCALRFTGKNNMLIHENNHHGTKHPIGGYRKKVDPVVCETCGQSFENKPSLASHIRRKHNQSKEKPKCTVCGKTFTEHASLVRHMQLHMEPRPYSCNQCNCSFQRLLLLKHHVMRKHEGKNPNYVCGICNEEFKTHAALYGHRRVIHRNKPFPHNVDPTRNALICQLCNEFFYKTAELQKHISTDHADEDYPYIECPQCPRKFISKYALAQHKAAHGDRCLCKECGKQYTTAQALRVHTESVHENRTYTCPECPGKTYKSMTALLSHMVKHKKGKQHACEFCDKTFLHAYQLRTHRRTHTGEKPFECPHCAKRFSDDGTFYKHRKRCREVKQEG